jgi:arylsulfatase A-like enzyme
MLEGPFIMSWPGTIQAGHTSDLLVSSMDIFSTVIELAGAKLPTDRVIDGVNVMPHLDSSDP